MPEELIMRGQTASGNSETLNFGGHTPGHAYQIVKFDLYPSTGLESDNPVLVGSVTAAKTASDPQNPNFDDPGLIATTTLNYDAGAKDGGIALSIINDLFYITQDLILTVVNGTSSEAVNWHCKFRKVKLSGAAEAVANFNQYTIFDE